MTNTAYDLAVVEAPAKPANYNPHKHVRNHRRSLQRRNHPRRFSIGQWKRMLKHFRWRCAYCGVAFTDYNRPTIDHVIPLAHPETPGNVISNVVPACARCNSAKADSEAAAWLTSRFGADCASLILARIQAYAHSLKERVS